MTGPMRVVAVIHVPDSPFSSVAGAVRHIGARLAAAGGTFVLESPASYPSMSRVPARLFPLVLPFVVAWRRWRRRDADLAIFHSYTGWVFNVLNRWRARPVPTITDFHGLEPIAYEALRAEKRRQGTDLSLRFRWTYGWLVPRLLRVSCRRSTRVVCLNPAEGRYLVAHGWAAPDRVVVLPPGAPPEVFAAPDRHYAPVARRLLFISQWLDTKGTRYLVEAFTTLVRQGHDVLLVCAGTRQPDAAVTGSFPADVRARVINRAELDRDALAAECRTADLFVHASVSEGCSRAQLEAMRSGLPLVTTRTSPAGDLLSPDRAVFVPTGDAAALTRALAALLPDQAARQRLGRAAADAAAALREDDQAVTMAALARALVTARPPV